MLTGEVTTLGNSQRLPNLGSFTFLVPDRIVFGWDALNKIGDELTALGAVSPLIITSKGMVNRDGFSRLTALLKKESLSPVAFSDVEPEPSMKTVEHCIEVAAKEDCDSIIGFGGGSVMDVAKKAAMEADLPKVMVSTTAGTGSEVTHESVLKVEGKKRAFVDNKLVPDVAIVDPSLLMTMPKRLIASSGIDALAHAVESYDCKRGNTLTKGLARMAYLLIKENISKAVQYDRSAVSNMALASLIAGMAFGNSGTALCHALTYPLSNMGIPHGEAVAIMLPLALEFNDFDAELVQEIRTIIRAVGLPESFEGNVEEMANIVIEDTRHLSNNPKPVTLEDIVGIYQKAVGRV